MDAGALGFLGGAFGGRLVAVVGRFGDEERAEQVDPLVGVVHVMQDFGVVDDDGVYLDRFGVGVGLHGRVLTENT